MKKVLIIDDTKNIRVLLQKVLQLEGFVAETAANGREGLEMIRNNAYSLIFLDIKLPEVSGTEILKTIRGEGNNTPVIIMTAYATIKNAVDCIQLGAITYIQKPFTADRIMNTMKQFNISAENALPSPSDGEVNWDAIREAYRNKNYRETKKMLSSMLSQDPTNGKIYMLLAKCYRALGDEATAEKFQQTGKLFSSSTE